MDKSDAYIRRVLMAEKVIGRFESEPFNVVCRREPEVGIAWEVCVDELGLCALGHSPSEAAQNLERALRERGIGGRIEIEEAVANPHDSDGGTDGPDGY